MPLRIVVGVGGGIAAFKAAHLVRFFKEQGHIVHVIPTPNALRFVGQATFEALSGNPVSTDVFDGVDEVQHVRLGQEADLIVIAPATADLMARLAHGRADDLLTSSCLVATCPVVIAPAMHTEMWEHPATRENVATLRRHGHVVLDPAHGRLTGKDTGPGRLPEPDHIGELALVAQRLGRSAFARDLEGKKVVISAGGTHEALDPVRYIGNASSGRQGFALADIAAQRGAEVVLVSGVTEELPTPSGARLVRVVSAREMEEAVREHSEDADVIIMAAAVADYRPTRVAASKMKKQASVAQEAEPAAAAGETMLELVENPDILAGLVQRRRGAKPGSAIARQLIIGFAAETGDENHSPLDYGRIKLKKKGCDLLMCNAVGAGKVFGQAENEGWLLQPAAQAEARVPEADSAEVIDIPRGSKREVAVAIWDEISQALSERA